MYLYRFLIVSCFGLFISCSSINPKAPVNGPLRIHRANPVYFTDNSGKAIYLSGHQIFIDLQDPASRMLDWPGYLQLLTDKNMNYIRNWSESAFTASPAGVSPLPYKRVSGYGNANDGGDKFDLYQFEQSFFDRMRARAIDLGNRGVYISYMLFDVYGFKSPQNPGVGLNQVFNANNNINGIEASDLSFFFSPSPELMVLQKAYVSKVIDTVGDLDNVFFEIANELGAVSWQYEIINHIKNYEASRPKQHLILYSPAGLLRDGTKYHDSSLDEAYASGASVYSVASGWGDYINNPPMNNTRVPLIIDMDHISGWRDQSMSTLAQIPWKAFMRGYHFNLYDAPYEDLTMESSDWDKYRTSTGSTVTYAKRIADLAGMLPSTKVSSTGFALAKAGSDYLVYAPGGGSFNVNLQNGNYSYEWFDPNTARLVNTGCVKAWGGSQSFSPPFSGDAVLYLTSGTSRNRPPSVPSRCGTIRNSSLAVPSSEAFFNIPIGRELPADSASYLSFYS
jgi:hypothetical protein